jgi:hypothetical protein
MRRFGRTRTPLATMPAQLKVVSIPIARVQHRIQMPPDFCVARDVGRLIGFG